MKKQMGKNRIIALLMALCMLITMTPLTAYAGLFDSGYSIAGTVGGSKINNYVYDVICKVTVNKELTLGGNARFQRSNHIIGGHKFIYSNGPLFYVPNGCTLTLKDNAVVTAEPYDNCDQPMIEVASGGKLILEGNAAIRDITSYQQPAVLLHDGAVFEMKGGVIQNAKRGVLVESGATFTMTGGIIKDCLGTNGAAVRVDGGTFNMAGAVIEHCGGYLTGFGGGIALVNGASFTVSNSTIKDCHSTFGGGIYLDDQNRIPDLSTVTFSGNSTEYGKDKEKCKNIYVKGLDDSPITIPTYKDYIRFNYRDECFNNPQGVIVKTLDGVEIRAGTSISAYIGGKLQYCVGTSSFMQFPVDARPEIDAGVIDRAQRKITLPVGYRYNLSSPDINDSRWVTVTSETVLTLPADESEAVYIYKMATDSAFRSAVTACTARVQISFDTGFGQAITPKTAYCGELYGALPVPASAPGYDFEGWYTEKSGGAKIGENTIVTNGDFHTLHARWTPYTYTIQFGRNGGNGGTMNDISAVFGQPVTLPASKFTHADSNMRVFGWTLNADGSGTVYQDASQVKNLTSVKNGTVTLYAKWISIAIIDGYYQIGNLEQLNYFKNLVNTSTKNANARLTADIDLKTITNWEPIAPIDNIGIHNWAGQYGYGGTFDGNGKAIVNMTIVTESGIDNGFFGFIQGGAIRNLSMKNVNINMSSAEVGKTKYFGALAGYMKNGTIDHCSVESGTVKTVVITGRTGGLAGSAENSAIKNCSNKAKVDADYSRSNNSRAGGIAGEGNSARIENCRNAGEVYAIGSDTTAGGIAGASSGGGAAVQNCYNVGKVHSDGAWRIGAILGSGAAAGQGKWLENNGAAGPDEDKMTDAQMKSDALVTALNNWVNGKSGFLRWAKVAGGYPVLVSEARLSGITYSIGGAGAIAVPNFDKDKKSYSITVPCDKSQAAITLTPARIDGTATIAKNTGANLGTGNSVATIEIKTATGLTETYTVTFLVAGHTYGDYVANRDYTCRTDGTKTRTCSVCGHTETVANPGSADGVSHNWGPRTYNNDATCTKNGTWTATCQECGATETVEKYGSALGHTGGTATCTHRAVCTRCGVEYGELKPHTHSGFMDIQELTYFQDGIREDRCTVCGALLERVVTPKLIDLNQPSGEISIGANKWREFLNAITFGLFFKETVSVSITGADNESGLDKIYYYKSLKTLEFVDLLALTDSDWTEGRELSLSPKDTCIVYAKLTDKVGNAAFLNTQGVVVDDAPSTLNVVYPEEGVWTANENAAISVTAFDDVGGVDALKSVTYSIDGGAEQTPEDIHSFSIGGLPDGDYDVVVTATDQTDITTAKTVRVKKDTAEPALSLSGNTGDYRRSDLLTITPVVGPSGVKKVEVLKQDGDAVINTDITATWQNGYTVTESKTYGIRVTNGAGVVCGEEITYTKIDAVKPVVALDSYGYEDGKWTTENVTLEVTNRTANLGTTTMEYAVGNGSYRAYTGAIAISDDTAGTTYHFRATSAAGAVSDIVSITVKLDKTNPAGEITVGANKWNALLNGITFGLFFKETQTVSIAGSDATSGVKSIEYQVVKNEADFNPNGAWTAGGGFTVAPDKKAAVYAKITDHADHAVIINSNGLVIDATAPSLTAAYAKDGQWTVEASAKINVTALDTVDGLDVLDSVTYTINGGTVQTPADIHSFSISSLPDGQYDVVITAANKSGITNEKKVAVKKDAAVPTISAAGSTADYKPSDKVIVTASAGVLDAATVEVQKDGGSWTDITASYKDGYNVTANGTYVFRITNGAGVTATDSLVYTMIDAAKPVVALDANGYEGGGWSTGDVTLEVTNSAANLGATSFEYAVDEESFTPYTEAVVISADTAGTTYRFRATSASGVVSDVVSIEVKVDKTTPACEITLGTNQWNTFLNNITFGLFFKERQTVSITGTDTTSGVQSIAYQMVESESEYDADGTWVTGSSFNMEQDNKAVIYAKVTDYAGNITVVNSPGIVAYTDSTIADDSAEFDLDVNREGYRDIDVTLTLNHNTLKSIILGDDVLAEGQDYTVNAAGDTVTLKKEYLALVVKGEIEFIFHFNPMGETYVDTAGNAAPGTASFTITKLIHAKAPAFTADLSEDDSASYKKGDAADKLAVEAETDDGGEIGYQWYRNGQKIEGATGREFTPSTDKTGRFVYHCLATNTNNAVNGEMTATAESFTAEILVSHAQAAAPIIGAGAPTVTMLTDSEKLLEYALTDEDRANLEKGYNISVALKVEVMDGGVSESEKDSIDRVLNGYRAGKYLNISIVKTVVDAQGNINTTNVDTLTKPVRFLIDIPDELKKSGRSFTVIRVHNGAAEILTDLDSDPNTVTIESDRFSVYTLAYKDEVQKIPNTGDISKMILWIALLFVAGGLLITLSIAGKRRK